MKELSCFIDESGDYGAYDYQAPYYIVTLVFHDQEHDISNNVNRLNDVIKHSKPLLLIKSN